MKARVPLVIGTSLAGVLCLGKLLVLVLRFHDGAPLGAWRALAMVREEALVALVVAVAAVILRRFVGPRAAWAPYAVFAAIAAISVPITRVFATPLTISMLGATGGALSDSIRRYVTVGNVVAVMLVGVAALVLPRLVRRLGAGAVAASSAFVFALAIAGSFAASRADTLGMHRDPVLTLARTAWARTELAAPASAAGPTVEARGPALDLEHLRGAARGKHVVWIVLESTGARYLAPWGAHEDPMPNLTELSSHGVIFDRAYAVYPESIKGLYAMLCSFAPAPHTAAESYAAARLPCTSIARTMKDGGYTTSLHHSGHFLYLGMEHIVRERGFDVLADARTIGGRHFSSFGTDDMSTAEAVLRRFDDRKPGERVFAMYMPISGHHPYETPADGPRPFGERTDLDRYRSDLYRGDLALGALIRGLRDRGVFEDTIFVVHGDHGEAFFQHEGNFAHSLHAWNENVHVPLLVAMPGVLMQSSHAPQTVTLLDVAPTIADLAGLEAPRSWQGTTMLDGRPHVARFFADYGAQSELGITDGRYKALVIEGAGTRLFDLRSDPDETLDLSTDHPDVADRMRGDLESWAARSRARVR